MTYPKCRRRYTSIAQGCEGTSPLDHVICPDQASKTSAPSGTHLYDSGLDGTRADAVDPGVCGRIMRGQNTRRPRESSSRGIDLTEFMPSPFALFVRTVPTFRFHLARIHRQAMVIVVKTATEGPKERQSGDFRRERRLPRHRMRSSRGAGGRAERRGRPQQQSWNPGASGPVAA